MTASNTAASKLNDSLEQTKELVKKLQGEKLSRNDILVQLNKLVYDTSLFSQKQRAIAIREINKAFGLNVTMNELKRAVKTVNVKKESAVPVDGLKGTATLDLEPAAEKPATEINTTSTAVTSSSSNTQETENMKNVKQVLEAASSKLNVEAPEVNQTHDAKVEALKANFATLGLTTETEHAALINSFFAINRDLAGKWELVKANQGGNGILGAFVAFLEIEPTAADLLAKMTTGAEEAPAVAPVGDLNATAPAAGAAPGQPEISVAAAVSVASGYKERVMTTLRGNRKSGFSSGVVAAAAAVIGGGIEMAVKGNVGIGSSVGTALGATGAYFLGNATDELMGTETGRYLLAGAIGVAAGGIGSRVGRSVESEFRNPSAETLSVLESIPGVTVTAPEPAPALVGDSEALFAKFGL